jgi:hypothetical protein
MARVVGRSRPKPEGVTGLKFTEVIVFGMILALLAAGGNWYYQYRKGPAFALQAFFNEVKSRSATRQYEFLDDEDKKLFPTVHDYVEKSILAHGFPERISNVSEEPLVQRSPTEVSIQATVTIKDTGEGKELYQGGSSHSFMDTYILRKNADGKWKIVLSKSGKNSLESCCNNMEIGKATASPEVSNF